MSEKKKKRLFIQVDRDGWTKGLQLSIDLEDSHGYRLAGPKYNGSSTSVFRHVVTERDAKEIRRYLDTVFPVEGHPNAS